MWRRWRLVMVAVVLVMVGTATGTTAVDGVSVGFDPDSASVPEGATATLAVTVSDATGGVGAVDLTVSVDSGNVADIASVTVLGDPAQANTTYSGDATSVRITGSGMDTADSGRVTVARVQVRGSQSGDTGLSLSVTSLGDEDGNRYNITAVRDGRVEVGDESDGSSSSESTPTPTATTTSTTTPTPTATPTEAETATATPGGEEPGTAASTRTSPTASAPTTTTLADRTATVTPPPASGTAPVAQETGSGTTESTDIPPTVIPLLIVLLLIILSVGPDILANRD